MSLVVEERKVVKGSFPLNELERMLARLSRLLPHPAFTFTAMGSVARYLFSSLVVSSASFLAAQTIDTELPKVTHKVFFDVKDGEKDLGRSTYT